MHFFQCVFVVAAHHLIFFRVVFWDFSVLIRKWQEGFWMCFQWKNLFLFSDNECHRCTSPSNTLLRISNPESINSKSFYFALVRKWVDCSLPLFACFFLPLHIKCKLCDWVSISIHQWFLLIFNAISLYTQQESSNWIEPNQIWIRIARKRKANVVLLNCPLRMAWWTIERNVIFILNYLFEMAFYIIFIGNFVFHWHSMIVL